MTRTESVSAGSPKLALRPFSIKAKNPLSFSAHLAANTNVYSTRGSKPFETILYTSFRWSKRTSEWNLCHKCRQQACLLYVNKQLWLLSAKYPGGYGLYRLHTRVFALVYCGYEGTGGTGNMEVYQRIPGPAIRGSEDSIAGPGWQSSPEVISEGGICG